MKDGISSAWATEIWPLSIAVCWIATRGDVSMLDNDEALEAAANELFRAFQTGKLVTYGERNGRDGPEIVPPAHFRAAAPFLSEVPDEILFNEHGATFLHWRALTDARPELSEGDCIMRRHETIWKRLTVESVSIQEKWPASRKPGTKRGRGRPGDVNERVMAQMRRDLIAGVDIAGMKREALAARYKCAGGTAEKALKKILSGNR